MARTSSFLRFLLAASLTISLLAVPLSAQQNQKQQKQPKKTARRGAEDSEQGEGDAVRRRQEWFYRQRAYPLGHIPGGARQRALERTEEMRREQRAAKGNQAAVPDGASAAAAAPGSNPSSAAASITLSTMVWTPIGPMPTNTGSSVGNVSGRVSAIAVDPTNANTVFAGAAQGGVWKSTDGGVNWTTTFDGSKSLAIGGIAIDPSNHNTIYVGTGEENFAQDTYYGAGIYKSVDGGATWTQTPGTISPAIPGSSITSFNGPFNEVVGGVHIGAIVVHPTTSTRVFAAVQIFQNVDGGLASGIFCSDDSGNTWRQVIGGAVGTDIAITPAGSIAYAALGSPGGDNFATDTAPGQNGVYKTTQANTPCTNQVLGQPGAWQKLTNPGGLASISMGRIRLDSDSTGNIVYAMVADGANRSDTLAGIFKTVNGGTAWTNVTTASPSDVCASQCFFDMVIKVHPNDPNAVFAGGSGVTVGGVPSFLLRTNNSGGAWSQIAQDANGTRLHVDQHAVAFGFTGGVVSKMYVGNDGGIWSTPLTSPRNAVQWSNLNQNLQLTQFYNGVSIHPASPQIAFAGAQDNGTQKFDPTVNPANQLQWTDTGACGDGGYTAIDPAAPSTVYAACQNISIGKSNQNGNDQFPIVADTGINQNDQSEFIPPLVIDPNPATSQRLYFGTFRVWQTLNGATNWSAISPDLTAGSTPANGLDITSISVSPVNSNTVYAGTFDSKVWRTTQANLGTGALNSWTKIDGGTLPGRAITQVAADPNNANVVFVTMSGFNCTGNPMCLAGDTMGHVFRCSAVTPIGCTDISGGLPNIPVNTIVVDPADPLSLTLYIGTDVGVFGTIDGGLSWIVDYPGAPNAFPNVAVFGLALQPTARILRAVTHGRGAWDLQLPTPAGLYNITGISPTTAAAGTPGPFLLTVNGNGFSATSKVLFNNIVHSPASQTATQLTVNLTTADLAVPGTVSVQVSDAAQAAVTTNTLPFTITTAGPIVTASAPASTPVNTAVNNMIITGMNFITTSVVRINNNGGSVSDTLMPSSILNGGTTINVTIPANAQSVQNPGTYFVTVFNLLPGGGDSSADPMHIPPNFTVTPANNTPRPPNDDFANAKSCTGAGNCDTVNTVTATTQNTDPVPSCTVGSPGLVAQGGANSIWYKFTATGPGTIEADTGVPPASSSLDDTILAVVTGAPGGFTEVACNDDIVTAVTRTSQVMFNATQGTTYFFMVSSFNAAGGKVIFNLNANLSAPSDFTIMANPMSATVTRGQSASTTLSIGPTGGQFPGDVKFKCSGQPSEAVCIFTPATVLQSSAATNVNLTITTTAPSMVPSTPWRGPGGPPLGLLLWALAALMLVGLLAARRTARSCRYALSFVLIVIFAGLAMSCGGGGGAVHDPGSLPLGANMVTVTATSGNMTHTVPFTVTLQ